MTKKTNENEIPLSIIQMESKKILSKDKDKKPTPEQEELMELLNLNPFVEVIMTSPSKDRMIDNWDITELKCSVVWDGTLRVLPYSGKQINDGEDRHCTISRDSEDPCPFGNIYKGCTVQEDCTDCEINTKSILTQLSALYISGKKKPLEVKIEKRHKTTIGKYGPTMETQISVKQIDFSFPSMEPSIFVRQYTNGR